MNLKNLILLLAMLISYTVPGQTDQVLVLRKKYKSALNNPKQAENLYQELSKQNSPDPVEMAYYGASQALMAKNAKGLNKKMSFLKEFEKTFDEAIKKNENHIEIRFLRFGIISHLPALIKDNNKLTEDKNKIIQNISKAEDYGVGKAFKKEIVDFVLNSGECTPEEKKKLNTLDI